MRKDQKQKKKMDNLDADQKLIIKGKNYPKGNIIKNNRIKQEQEIQFLQQQQRQYLDHDINMPFNIPVSDIQGHNKMIQNLNMHLSQKNSKVSQISGSHQNQPQYPGMQNYISENVKIDQHIQMPFQELITQTQKVNQKNNEQKQNKMTTNEMHDLIKRENLNAKIIIDCEDTLKLMQNNTQINKKFCFKEEKFEKKRLVKDNNPVSEDEFLQCLTRLNVMGVGAQNIEGVRRYHDCADICFGGDHVIKKLSFNTNQQRIKAYRELNIMNIINQIPNGEQYFALLRCCFIERITPTIDSYNLVLIIEFGRNSMEQMLQMNRKYSEHELLTILRHILTGCTLLQNYHIAQNDFKPGNIILNRQYDQVKIIDFGMALHVPESINQQDLIELKWRGGSPVYASPQHLSAYFKSLSPSTKYCQSYNTALYSPFKSDVYSIAMMICELAGLELPKDMKNCFQIRSDDDKRQLLEKYFSQSKELASILWHMLLNDEQNRWSFEQVLKATKNMKGSILDAKKEENHIITHKLSKPEKLKLSATKQDNYIDLYNKSIQHYDAGTFKDALQYVERCLKYVSSYEYENSQKDRVRALRFKGECLRRLDYKESAALAYKEALDQLRISKKYYNDENDYQLNLGRCLSKMAWITYDQQKNCKETLQYCEDALIALHSDNQQFQPENELSICEVYNTKAGMYTDLKQFAKARKNHKLVYDIALQRNLIKWQAIYFSNMCSLKMDEHEFDEEALQLAEKSLLLFGKYYQGQNNQHALTLLFTKCFILCTNEQWRLKYEETFKLALQIAKNLIGGGHENIEYVKFIKDKGLVGIKFANDMKSNSLFKIAYRLIEESRRAVSSLNIITQDTINLKQCLESIINRDLKIKDFHQPPFIPYQQKLYYDSNKKIYIVK